jgi:UDPglucose--hexose-1-phosphate uridylyltransferase
LSTPDLRRDYFTKRLVIIAAENSKQRASIKKTGRGMKAQILSKNCQFCPGNESKTPSADLVLVSKEGTLAKLSDESGDYVKGWTVRAFLNKFPAVTPDAPHTYSDPPLYSEPAIGYHYVVVMTPKHIIDISEIDEDQWINILTTVQDKSRWLYSKKNVSYVAIFLNHGPDAGASAEHPHLQIMSLPILPPSIDQEARFVQKPLRERGVCPMCEVIEKEEKGPRLIWSTDNFIVFAPWASVHRYEFWIFPKPHQTSFLKVTQRQVGELAEILRLSLKALAKSLNNPSFNLVMHTSPEKKTSKQIHWHVEVYPRLYRRAGLDRGMGIYVNTVPPERAAADLRKTIQILNKKKW